MRKNLSRAEALFRLGFGSLMFYFFIIGGPVWNLTGLYFMLTGSFRFCPFYYYLGNRSV
jgi:hypothetical protein